MLAATAWNLKKLMKELLQALLCLIRTLADSMAEQLFISKRPILGKYLLRNDYLRQAAIHIRR